MTGTDFKYDVFKSYGKTVEIVCLQWSAVLLQGGV